MLLMYILMLQYLSLQRAHQEITRSVEANDPPAAQKACFFPIDQHDKRAVCEQDATTCEQDRL